MRRVALQDAHNLDFTVLVSEVERPFARLVFLPGAACEAARYAWLATALRPHKISALIPDPPVTTVPALTDPGRMVERSMVTIDQFHRTLELARQQGGNIPLIAGGHSLGGCIVMEALDPAEASRNPRTNPHDRQPPPRDLAAIVIVGASMQPVVGSFRLPWRNETERLERPHLTPMLFVSGAADTLVTATSIAATASRYASPVTLVSLAGVKHFDWTEGTGALDLPEPGGPSDRSVAQAGTVNLLADWITRQLDVAA